MHTTSGINRSSGLSPPKGFRFVFTVVCATTEVVVDDVDVVVVLEMVVNSAIASAEVSFDSST